MKIYVEHDDGSKIEITEGVQAAYDVAWGSLDWGSGFLSTEDMTAIANLAGACDFPSFRDVLNSVEAHKREEENCQRIRRERDAHEREMNRRRI